jgi:hypothetical protein
MKENIDILINKFKLLKSAGFVEGIKKNKNAGGIVLENKFNCGADDLCFPDYEGIELKAIRDYDDAPIELFNDTPSGPYMNTTQWLTNKYGYPDKTWREKKAFKGDVNSQVINKIGLFYGYKLRVEKKKLILEIYNFYNKKINEDLYWEFEWLKRKLETKLKYFALINTTRIYSKGKYYYNYNNMKIYKLKDFNVFIELLKQGIITITFKNGYYKSGKYKGNFHDHGTSFRIHKKDLSKLFDLITSA